MLPGKLLETISEEAITIIKSLGDIHAKKKIPPVFFLSFQAKDINLATTLNLKLHAFITILGPLGFIHDIICSHTWFKVHHFT